MTGKKQIRPFLIRSLLLLVLVLSACQEVPPTRISPSSTPHQPRLSTTPTPSLTLTTAPGHTSTPILEPSPEATQTPTLTNTPDPPNLSLTPVSEELSLITKDNLNQVEHLAIWGNGAPNEIVLSGDTSLLAVGTDLGTFLYDSFDFRFVTLLRSEQPVSAIAFSPDNERIAVTEGSHQLKIYNQPQFQQIEALHLSSHPRREVSKHTLFFTPESDHLTLVMETNQEITVTRWEVATWESTAHFSVKAGQKTFVNRSIGVLGVVTEENLILHSLVLPEDSRTLPLWPNQNEVRQAVQTNVPSPIIPAASGKFLLLNQGTAVAYWDIVDNKIEYKLEDYLYVEPYPCEEIPDTCRNLEGDFSFSCSADLASPRHPIQLLTITPDDQRMLISLDSNRTELRSTYSGELIWAVDAGYTKALFSLNDIFLLGLRSDGAIEKRDLLDGELLLTLKQHPSRFFDMDFSPDGSLLAAGFTDDWIRVFSTQTGEMLGVLEGSAQRLRFSPDGGQLAAGLVNGTLRVFQLDRGRSFDLGSGHLGAVTGIAFSPDGLRLSTTSLDCTINRWDVKNRYKTDSLIPLNENPIQILDIEKSTDNAMFYAVGAQDIIAIEGERVTRVFSSGQDDTISDIALAQDGQHLAAGGTSIWLFKLVEAGWTSIPIQTPSSLNENGFRIAFLSDAGLLLAVDGQAITFYGFNDNLEPALLHQLPLPPSLGHPVSLVLSPWGDLIAIASENGLVHIFGITGTSN